jgi:hypothetical protein
MSHKHTFGNEPEEKSHDYASEASEAALGLSLFARTPHPLLYV